MLIIRKKQMEVFKNPTTDDFLDQMVTHLRKFYPKHCEMLEDSTIKDIIKYGHDRARTYNFDTSRTVGLFTNLMFLLGSRFDIDPQLPWVSEILNDETMTDAEDRASILYDKAMAYLDTVSGKDNEHLNAALKNIKQKPIRNLSLFGRGDFDRYIHTLLHRIFTSKYDYLGKANVQQLIIQGAEEAGNNGLPTPQGAAIYIGMMFILGSGFASDPLYPWVRDILSDKNLKEPEQLADELQRTAMAYLDRWVV
ncbi:MAG: hypothetical protein U9N60_04715 [Thermodesulfobacteriota bacterium]|nr:hypothetical protein [Thermodesulfobacteriota bacterium]